MKVLFFLFALVLMLFISLEVNSKKLKTNTKQCPPYCKSSKSANPNIENSEKN
jgi:hypothetical protein